MVKIFTSTSCGPCHIYKQQLEGLPGIQFIDVDDPGNLHEAIAANIMQVPTTILPSGEVWTGVQPRERIVSAIGGVVGGCSRLVLGVPGLFNSGSPDSQPF